MPRTKKSERAEERATPEQEEMMFLRSVARAERTQDQKDRLAELVEGERRDRFVRQAERRVGQALKAIGRVGMLGNRLTYKYDDREANSIIEALATGVAKCRGEFQTRKEASGFRLF